MNSRDPRTDSELAELAAGGDLVSATELGRRYVAALYDFAVRVTLDQGSAQGATEASLSRSITELAKRPPGLDYRAWLFGVARDECLEGIRQRIRPEVSEDDAPTTLSALDPRFARPPESGADEEIALWAWQAARAQRPRDYSLLDLALRRQLAAEEIADIASLSRSGIYAVLGRLRGAFEETFATTVLYFRGRATCPDLQAIGSSADNLGPAVRREIGRHSEGCDICRGIRGGLPLAADILGGLQNVAAPAELIALVAPPAPEAPAVAATAEPIESKAAAAPDEQATTPSQPILLRDAIIGAGAAAAGAAGVAGLGAMGTAATPEAAQEAVEEAVAIEAPPEAPAAPVEPVGEPEAVLEEPEPSIQMEPEPSIEEVATAIAEPEPAAAEEEPAVEALAEPVALEAPVEPEAVEALEAAAEPEMTAILVPAVPEAEESTTEPVEATVVEAAPDEVEAAVINEPEAVVAAEAPPELAPETEEPDEEWVAEAPDGIESDAAAAAASEDLIEEAAAPEERPSMLGRLRGIFGRRPVAPLPEPEPTESVTVEEAPEYVEAALPEPDVEPEYPDLATGELSEVPEAVSEMPAPSEPELAEDTEAPEAVAVELEADLAPEVAIGREEVIAAAPEVELVEEETESEGATEPEEPPEAEKRVAAYGGPGPGTRELAAAGVGASAAAVVLPREQVRGSGGRPPADRPPARGGLGGEGGRKRIFVFTVIGATTLAAIYLGVAFGDSIRGGGDVPSVVVPPLPTRAAGVREVACSTAPISIEQGSRATLTFDAQPLPGFEVAGVNVRAITPGASPQSVEATAQRGLSVLFEAFPVQAGTGRVDEYLLTVTFSRGSERTVSECVVLVTPAIAAPTVIVPTQPPPPPTVATQPPPPTATAIIIATVPPTLPPLLPTATPTEPPPPETPTPTTVPTFTATPSTRTPTPTFTLTPLPSPTPTPGTPTPSPTPTPTVPPALGQ